VVGVGVAAGAPSVLAPSGVLGVPGAFGVSCCAGGWGKP
jgi:hypothetical protein